MKVKRKILYLTYDGLTDALGQSQILPYLIGLSVEFDITVVSFEKKNVFSDRSKLVYEILSSRIQWIPKFYTKYPPVISTIFDLIKLNRICKLLVLKHSFHAVHCRSYLTSLIGVSLKKKYNLKFVFDMRGFWIEERIEGKLWSLSNPIHFAVYAYFKKKETRYLLNADHIVVLTKKAKHILLEGNRIVESLITVIPCCVDTGLFDYTKISEQQKIELKEKLNIKPDDMVLVYFGSIGTWYMLDEMLDFFIICLKEKPNSKFLFITNEVQSKIEKNAITKNIPLAKIIVTSGDRQAMPLLLSLADISIFFIRPTFSKQASSPTKLAETMAMGLTTIANSNIGDLDDYFASNEVGTLVNSFTDNNYLEASGSISRLLNLDKAKIRKMAISDFSLNEGIDRYKEVLRSL